MLEAFLAFQLQHMTRIFYHLSCHTESREISSDDLLKGSESLSFLFNILIWLPRTSTKRNIPVRICSNHMHALVLSCHSNNVWKLYSVIYGFPWIDARYFWFISLWQNTFIMVIFEISRCWWWLLQRLESWPSCCKKGLWISNAVDMSCW